MYRDTNTRVPVLLIVVMAVNQVLVLTVSHLLRQVLSKLQQVQNQALSI